MHNETTEVEQALILAAKDCPPLALLRGCTQDQANLWLITHHVYSEIAIAFDKQRRLQPVSFKGPHADHIRVKFNEYRALANLLVRAWDRMEQNLLDAGGELGIDSPAEAMLWVLVIDSIVPLKLSQMPFFSFSVKRWRETMRDLKKLFAKAATDSLLPVDQGVIAPRIFRTLREWDQAIALPPIKEALVSHAERAAEGDEDLTDLLKDYRKASSKLLSFIESSLHERKKVKGYQWIKGVKKPHP